MHAPSSDVSSENLAELAAGLLARLRARAPRVHCISNTVAQAFTANLLLAVGGVPSMTVDPDEVGAFVGSADAVLINIGTLDQGRREAIDVAVAAAAGRVPVVLDPVFVDRVPTRAAFARDLARRAPAVIRLNRAEFATLAECPPDAPVTQAVQSYANACGTVVALTGAQDWVADGMRLVTLHNGHPLMAQVTAMGCAGSALVAACLAVEPDPWRATAGALVALGVAGEIAGARARGPGSFVVEILDVLHSLDRVTLIQFTKVS
jgi:hydroxyethylthiazole kinase